MSTTDQDDWPIEQRDYPTGALIDERITFYIQARDDEGRWMPLGGVDDDRDRLTRTQAFRAQEHPSENRRVVRHVLQSWVEEVEGDGEDETSKTALLARNDENTARLIKEKAAEKAHASEEGA